MEFPTRKAIMKKNLKDGGRKRLREGDSSATTPPLKELAGGVNIIPSSSAVCGSIVRPGEVLTEVRLSTLPVTPVVAATGGELRDLSASASGQLQIGGDLDLELSLRQKRIHDVDVGDHTESRGKSTEQAVEPNVVDMRANEGDADGFEVVMRVDHGKQRGSTCADQLPRNDNASSSDGGTCGFVRGLYSSGNMTEDSDLRIDTNIIRDKIVSSTVILPANQRETLFDSARTHGLDVDMEGLEHDIERRAQDDRPTDSTQPPPEEPVDKTADNPESSSTPGLQLAFKQLGDRLLAAFDEQRKSLDEQRKVMEQLTANQSVAGTAAELARGVIFDLQTLMTRSPYRGALNFAFCGLMVAARLGHLTPHILEDPVVQILLGDHIEELRHVINSVIPYQHSFFHGPQ